MDHLVSQCLSQKHHSTEMRRQNIRSVTWRHLSSDWFLSSILSSKLFAIFKPKETTKLLKSMQTWQRRSATKPNRGMNASAEWACALFVNAVDLLNSLASISPLWLWGGGHDTLFTVDYRNGRVDPSRLFSYSFFLFASLCCTTAHPMLPWQQGLVQHGEEYGGRGGGRVHLHSSTNSRDPREI